MLSKYLLKKAFVVSAVIVGIMGFFLSCENPFANNMGEKVVRELPTISVISPEDGDFVDGIVSIYGKATADRMLASIEVRIIPQNNSTFNPMPNWTKINAPFIDPLTDTPYADTWGSFTSGGTESDWELHLDTKNFHATIPGTSSFPDGFFNLEFRVTDNAKNYSVINKKSYILKNYGPAVKLNYPKVEAGSMIIPALTTGGYIRGQVTDPRGLHPDFPQIKIWPITTIAGAPITYPGGEPSDDDINWGYMRMFLTEYDSPVGKDDGFGNLLTGPRDEDQWEGYYLDREAAGVTPRGAEFVFKLDEFTRKVDLTTGYGYAEYIVETDPSDPAGRIHKKMEYRQRYQFRIRTRDKRTNELDVYDGIIAYFPPSGFDTEDETDDNSTVPGDPITMRMVDDFVPITIVLEPDDGTSGTPDEETLGTRPNIYITEPNISKIKRTSGNDFDLRVRISHPDGINMNTGLAPSLTYSHGGTTTPLSATISGGTGRPVDPKILTFSGSLPAQPTPYILRVRAVSGTQSTERTVSYYLTLDGAGPEVRINSVQGYVGDPPSVDSVDGDQAKNDSAYTVNGNIRVTVDRRDVVSRIQGFEAYDPVTNPWNDMITPPPAGQGNGYPMVKWIVDEYNPANPGSEYANSLQKKLDDYRATSTRANLEFFYEIEPGDASGWVRNNPNDFSFEFRAWKDGSGSPPGNAWNNKDLWLYIIAQDSVGNLGYLRQKLHVDDDSDKPVMDVGLSSDITTLNELKVLVDTTDPDAPVITGNSLRKNVLESTDDIAVYFTDDDGIIPNGGITITLRNYNVTTGAQNATATLNATQLQTLFPASIINPANINQNSRVWSGSLTPALMGRALYGASATALRPGLYELVITVRDNAAVKVAIPGQPAPAAETLGPVSYFFAVYDAAANEPVIEVTAPSDLFLIKDQAIDIYGTVNSRFDIQKLLINFRPDVITPTPVVGSSKSVEVTLESPTTTTVDGVTLYRYIWREEGVKFANVPSSALNNSPLRRYTIIAYDRLGNIRRMERTIRVDTAPPYIDLDSFDDNRGTDVNGKVEFKIFVSDESGLNVFTGANASRAALKWWVLPDETTLANANGAATTAFDPPSDREAFWNMAIPAIPGTVNAGTMAGGLGLWALNADRVEGGIYQGVFDSRALKNGVRYKLWAAAQDSAGNYGYSGNENPVALAVFTVDQSADYPTIELLRPPDGVGSESIRNQGSLAITGLSRDDDRFDQTKVSDQYTPTGNNYVQIRFPRSYNNAGTPTAWNDADWINVPGRFDTQREMRFELEVEHILQRFPNFMNPAGGPSPGYFGFDGAKAYQIRVRDETVRGTAENSNNFGKNPTRHAAGQPVIGQLSGGNGTVGQLAAIYPDEDPLYVVDLIRFPTRPSGGYYYQFFLDNQMPIIKFDKNDPNQISDPDNPTHPRERPVFKSFGEVKGALSGSIVEANLTTLVISFGNERRTLVYKNEYNTNATDGIQPWDLDTVPFVDPTDYPLGSNDPGYLAALANASLRVTEFEAELQKAFDEAPQGALNISFEAIDVAGNIDTATWMFYKDTRGPDINPSINRVREGFEAPPPNIPANWPLDWPSIDANAKWKSVDPAVNANHDDWATLIDSPLDRYGLANWPTEFAFLPPTKILETLEAELKMTISVIQGIGAAAPVITGTFSDNYSAVWNANATTGAPLPNAQQTTFQYRFDSGGRADTSWPNAPKTIDQPAAGNRLQAAWTIPLTGVQDGKHTVDIKMTDERGNESVIYGLVFRVDRAAPYFGEVNTPQANQNQPDDIKANWTEPDPTNVNYDEPANWNPISVVTERVFGSLGSASSDTNVFSLRGKVYDANLKDLSVTISKEIGGADTIIDAYFDIDLYGTATAQVFDKVNGGDDTVRRLTVKPTTGIPGEYDWTLNILEKDVFLLQAAAGDGGRRFVRLSATDKALKNTGQMTWYFYLDTTSPKVLYTNFEAGSASTVFANGNAGLQGTAEDDTGIMQLEYNIAKWNYTLSRWEMYVSSTWDNLYAPASAPWNPITPGGSGTSVTWAVTPAMLTASGLGNAGAWVEGTYWLGLIASDYSLGNGNPNTAPTPPANPATALSTLNEKIFFIDDSPPVVEWADKDDPATYFMTDPVTKKMSFPFTVKADANTVDWNKIEVVLLGGSGAIGTPGNHITWDSGAAWEDIELTATPFGTDSGDFTGALLGATQGSILNYTLQVSIWDGAGNVAHITRQIAPDNLAPSFSMASPGEYYSGTLPSAIVGRVILGGVVTDNSGQFDKIPVAYSVRNSGSGFGASLSVDDSRWLYYDAADLPAGRILTDSDQVAMQIEANFPAWRITIPHTRYFDQPMKDGFTYYASYVTTDNDSHYYDGVAIPQGQELKELRVDILVRDQAGNHAIENRSYFIYDEGDRPVVVNIANPDKNIDEAQRFLNGTIRISGQAKDNERVKAVWFRVLGPDGITPYTSLKIPNWILNPAGDGTYISAGGPPQSPKTGEEISGPDSHMALPSENIAWLASTGWFMANRGGDGNQLASWWAQINTEGELQSLDGSPNEIKIEVYVEDTTRKADNADEWEPDNIAGKISARESIKATVVTNVPAFEDDRVMLGGTGVTFGATDPGWIPIASASLSKKAGYRIHVKNETAIGAIRWTKTVWDPNARPGVGDFIRSTDPSINLLDVTEASDYNDAMTVKAVAITSSGDGNGRYKEYYVVVIADTKDLQDYITGVDEDYGLKDVNGDPVDRYGNPAEGRRSQVRGSMHFPIYLSASDRSGSSPLTSNHAALLPIDNTPPRAEFTLNRRPAGTSQAIGGEAVDDGPVNGVARVILWFSRKNSLNEYINASWREKSAGSSFENYATNTGGWRWADSLIEDQVFANMTNFGATVAARLPYIPLDGDLSGGNSAIVIDRNNTMTGTNHHGHNLTMGFSVGGIGRIWYFDFNSTLMGNGPVMMHYVVIDNAGNGRYYEDPIVIMNDAPVIDRIKLGTDIRGNSTFAVDFPSSANYSTKTGAAVTNDVRVGSTQLNKIRDKMFVAGTTGPLLPEVQNGITDWLPSTALSADRLIDFNARNRLLALRVETSAVPDNSKARTYHFEYVHGAKLIDGDLTQVKAGKVYIVDSEPNETKAQLGGLGAEGAGPWPRGTAFLAAVNGGRLIQDGSNPPKYEPILSGYARLWELNPDVAVDHASGIPANLQIGDVAYTTGEASTARSAEFAYSGYAFGDTYGSYIKDFTGSDDWPSAEEVDPAFNHSLFILTVYDGPKEDLFCDFALLRIRVNNNDMTPPFAQLYDLNPLTEGERIQQSQARSLAPMSIGANRTKGSLWNDNFVNWRESIRSGHVEPRRISYNVSPYNGYQHSLSPVQMGGQAGYSAAVGWDDTGETVNPNAFFGTTDYVSGRVILRGYVEDDQRIEQVDLLFSNSSAPDTVLATLPILVTRSSPVPANPGNAANYQPPYTGLLEEATGTNVTGRVYYTDSIDVNRHRVEWAYIWDTQAVPANFVVGQARVRAVARNGNTTTPAIPQKASGVMRAGVTTPGQNPQETHTASSNTNPGFPEGLYKYNTIDLNLRPYITGFMRNQVEFYHNYRSVQGRVALSRGETPVVKGFNLGGGGATNSRVNFPGAPDRDTSAVTSQQVTNFNLSSGSASEYRILSAAIPNTATTAAEGNPYGAVTMYVTKDSTQYYAVNTRVGAAGERPLMSTNGSAPVDASAYPNNRHWIQPWNDESSGREGSDLWDDFTSVHIWQSDDTNSGTGANANRGYFPVTGSYLQIAPAMSIDPGTGVLYASHYESASGTNENDVYLTTNNGAARVSTHVFPDPIPFTDIFRSPTGRSWTVASMIGTWANEMAWQSRGGVFVGGQNHGGQNIDFGGGGGGRNLYYVESTWYNSTALGTNAYAGFTDQFAAPHIVTHEVGGSEHIHVSYYDTKDKSIKYRYNLQGANSFNTPIANTTAYMNDTLARTWINLDGGYDAQDMVASVAATNYTLASFGVPTSTAAVTRYLSQEGNAFPSANFYNYHLGAQATAQGHGTISSMAGAAVTRNLSDEISANSWTISAPAGTNSYYLYSEVGYEVTNLGTALNFSFNSGANQGGGANLAAGTWTVTAIHNNVDTGLPLVNGNYVAQGDPVYTVTSGAQTRIIYAAATGTITGMRSAGNPPPAFTVTATAAGGNASSNAAANLAYGINRVASNYVRQVHTNPDTGQPFATNDYIRNTATIYTIGPPLSSTYTRPIYTITAKRDGELYDLRTVGTQITSTNATAAANRTHSIRDIAYNFIRTVHDNPDTGQPFAATGDYVMVNDHIYTIGARSPYITAPVYQVYARTEGNLSNRRAVGDQVLITTTGDAATRRLFTITPSAFNYVHEVLPNPRTNAAWANGNYVQSGEEIYKIGVANANAKRATYYVFTAPMEGTISNLVARGTAITFGTAADNNTAAAGGTAAQRLFCIVPVQLNYINEVVIPPHKTTPWVNGDFVKAGELIYWVGQNPVSTTANPSPTNPAQTRYPVYATTEGTLSNMLGAGSTAISITGTAAAGRLYTVTPLAYNFLHWKTTITSGIVGANVHIYTFGVQNPGTYTRATTYEIRTPSGGTISNILATTAPSTTATGTGTIFSLRPESPEPRIVRNDVRSVAGYTPPDTGYHNAIATTAEGYPVVAYYDVTNQRLKLAVSRSVRPESSDLWVIRDYVIPRTSALSYSTGQYVTMKIDHGLAGKPNAAATRNTVHITAFNSLGGQLVYIKGQLNPGRGTGDALQDDQTADSNNVLTGVTLRVIDNLGVVGRWSAISLDELGNPWIAYKDDANRGSMDGIKLAYYGGTTLYPKELDDALGEVLDGWEIMFVPARYRVENEFYSGREEGRLGLETFPTRNYNSTNTQMWSGAIGYTGSGGGSTRYRIAYYVK